MTTPITPTGYRANMNRTVTKKWAEAKPINYDDWGEDDDEDYGDSRGYSAGIRGPSQQLPPGRTSFDRDDERRHFTSSAAGFEGPYPTAQRNPFPELQHEQPPAPFDQRAQPPLHLRTQSGRPSMDQQYSQGPYTADPRGQRYSDEMHAPFSAPGAPSGRTSQSSGRPSQAEMFPRNQSPYRPSSRDSGSAVGARGFPPRKSSLSQQQSPMDIPSIQMQEPDEAPTSVSEVKPVPFIRPADIYKRVEEERERERRSQESSRPSFESAASRLKDNSAVRSATESPDRSDVAHNINMGEGEASRRARSPLEPVAERKSEYGLENMIRNAGLASPDESQSDMASPPLEHESLAAASPPTLHPTRHENVSADPETPMPHVLPPVRGVSDFGDSFFRPDSFQAPPTSLPPSATDVPLPVPTPGEPAGRATREDTTGPTARPADSLHHNPSQGYRSVVSQAFDNSQDQVPATPASTTDTVERSNSASTSDISPIMTRGADSIAGRAGFSSFHAQPSIPEEQQEASRPTSSRTITQAQSDGLEARALPPPIVPGYRRESIPPSPDNSPAKPLQFTESEVPEANKAVIASSERSTTQQPAYFPPSLAQHDFEESAAPPQRPELNDRTASEDLRDWEVQRKQFKSKFGLQDSPVSTPGIPSPIPQAESPNKGTVREIAGKLESRTGQTSPLANEVARPIPNPRLESFRPSIPGGWQSYTTNTGASTPQPEPLASEHAPTPPEKSLEEAAEEVPTAGPWRSTKDGPMTSPARSEGPMASAFAAAAAAGSALVGAFASTGDEAHKPENGVHGRPANLERHETDQTDTTYDSERPTPLPKDTPSEVDVPQSTLGYFPAPLRKAQNTEAVTPLRPTIHTALSTETSPNDDENDRLRKEIVKSLTPRSSQYGGENARPFDEPDRLPPSIPAQYQLEEAKQEYVLKAELEQEESALPQEYDSYWNDDPEPEEPEKPNHRHGGLDAAASVKSQPMPAALPVATAIEAPEEMEPAPTAGLPERFSWETSTDQLKSKQPSQIFPYPAESRVTSTSTLGDVPSYTASPAPDRMEAEDAPAAAVGTGRVTPRIAAVREASPDLASPASPRNAGSPNPVRDERGSMSPVSPEIPTVTLAAAMESPSRPQQPQTPSKDGVPKTLPSPRDGSTNTNFINFQEVPFRDILALESPQQRIQAYNNNRQYYAQSQDQNLGHWLQSMGRQPEHSQMLSNNGNLTNDDYTALNTYRPTPPRSKFRIVSDSGSPRADAGSGAKVQEGGKQLLQAANKYGGKAGLAAKGLLARGKDKLRTVSAGDKGLPTRRQSSQQEPLPSDESPSQLQHSSSSAPQIPAPVLATTPITEEDPWHLYTSPGGNYQVTPPSGPATPALSTNPLRQRLSSRQNPTISEPPSRALAVGDATGSSGASQTISPAVSAAGSTENAALPSRSISEATQPGDVPAISETRPAESPSTLTANAPGSFPLTPAADPATSRQPPSLGLLGQPVDDRKSMVSNISTPSPLPGDNERRQSMSPAVANTPRQEDAPDYEREAPKRDVEAGDEPPEESTQRTQDGVPSYQTFDDQARPVPSPLATDTAADSLTGGAVRKREGDRPSQDRPFSFEGSDSAFRTSPRLGQDQADPGQPEPRPTPTEPARQNSRPLNKVEPSVTVQEVRDDGDDLSPPRKSYSRPFGAEPSVQEHPALHGVTPDINRSQIFSTDSPLPTPPPPRPQQQRPSNQTPTSGEEQYRIPGPYVQEYRSPKQPQPPPPAFDHPTAEDPEKPRPFAQPLPESPIQISTSSKRPEAERSKRSFGGFFQSRPKSRQHPDLPTTDKQDKRNGLFRSQSRNDSVSSQESRLGSLRQTPSRDQVRPEQVDKSKKRRSMDLLRGISHGTPSNEPTDGKKKRSSGLGGLFSKRTSQQPQRASTLDPQIDRPGQQGGYPPRTSSVQQGGLVPGAFPDSAYYETRAQQQQQQSPASMFPHGPDSIVGGRLPADESGPGYGPAPQDMAQDMPQQQQQYQDLGRIQTYAQPYDQRQSHVQPQPEQPQSRQYLDGVDERPPGNLRINTGGDQLQQAPTAATAPAGQAQPKPFMISRQATEPSVTPIPSPYRAPNQEQARARELHKRAHSPKLGRQDSTDDTERQADPARDLGTFAKPPSPRAGGDEAQEKPWRIDLPPAHDEANETKRRAAKRVLIERSGSTATATTAGSTEQNQSVAERLLGAQQPAARPLGRNDSAGNRGRGDLVELPGSKVDADADEDEVVMSATAGPNDTWMPVDMGYGRWDD